MYILAGFISTIPNNPLEVIKLQLQTHSKTLNPKRIFYQN